ncbi:hypothetical protein CCACVL1_14097 [Corchorus capsularis]|uniref:Uncharacterized protein n=1 Tax=Corchorus capsularis TaxID=210143 RepID=A0A1R3I8F7_COCAP|nr:hypothetical protein CCACVL1_14097 [Corchorus capsularis]
MRIRKNAKLSSMIYPDGSRRESVHVCQLNQSPWDVIPFSEEPYPSSIHHQFETEDSFNGNGSLGDSIGAVESVASMMESEDKAILKAEGMIIDDNDDTDEVIKIGEEFVFRSQCDEEDDSRQEGLLKSCSNINHSNDSENNPSSLTNKKAEKNNQLTGSRRGRARAARRGSSSAASNPYEFYYYSGFGPLWGKRRGGGSDRAGEISKNIEAKDVENNSSAITTQNNTTPSSSSQIDNNEEFDYVDDEDDEEDDENGDSGKKRMRKPVKARSLKSLM